MQLIQTIIEKNFIIKQKGKIYYISYINSDRPCLALVNRFHWEILDEEHEELNIYYTNDCDKEEIDKNNELAEKLINFCKKHVKNQQ